MAGRAAVLTVRILTDAENATRGVDQAAGRFGKLQSGLQKMAIPAAAALGALGVLGKAAVDSASRQEQAFGALDSVFGRNAATVKGWAASAADSVGLSRSEYAEFASVLGAQLRNLTGDTQLAMSGTRDMISLGADLAATFGGTTADAVNALSAALRGEADPAERYGLALNQTAVNAYLAERGLDKLTGRQATAAKAQAVLEMATQQAGGAIGQFGREAGTVAGQQQILNARWEDAKADLGRGLLPIVADVTGKLAGMAGWVSRNSTAVGVAAGVIGAFSAAILILNGAIKAYQVIATVVAGVQAVMNASLLGTRVGLAALAAQQAIVTAATKVWTGVQWALNAALNANPVMLLVVAVVAAVAILGVLWQKSDGFRAFVIGAWNAIRAAAVAVWNAIKATVLRVISWARAYIQAWGTAVRAVWNAIRAAAVAVWNAIKATVLRVISWARSYIQAWGTAVRAVWNAIRAGAVAVWSAIRDVVARVIGSIKAIISGVRSTASAVWSGIKSAATSAFNAILSPIRSVKSAIESVISAVRSAIGWIGKIKLPKLDLGGLNPFSAAPAAAGRSLQPAPAGLVASPARAPSLARAVRQSYANRGGGNTTIINIDGALDPVSTARQIDRLLAGSQRRSSGITQVRRAATSGLI